MSIHWIRVSNDEGVVLMTLPEHVKYTGCPSWTIESTAHLMVGAVSRVECCCGAMFEMVTVAALNEAQKVATAARHSRSEF